jgi:hypothetical protein
MAQTDCPFNTYCAASTPQNFCVKQTNPVAQQKPTGQWGTHCLPNMGQENNPACDTATGFACYATGTTDATAYCTQYDCSADTDCAGGYYCATINKQPNAKSDARTFGKTRAVCLKREYCSPCQGDIDCPVIDGKQSLCTDADNGKYCASPCTSNANCRLDAACNGIAADGVTKVCRPRAGVCKGDGSFCSPCLADSDCPMGFCLKAAYSPEKFCSVKSTTTCAPPAMGTATIVKGSCPAFSHNSAQVGCQSSSSDDNIPKDQCIAIIPFGDADDIACWTKHP